MFLTSVFSGAGINATDPDEERNPPPEPTPVTFPTYQACNVTIWGDTEAPPDYYALFARLSRPADISQDHVDALNIEICPPCSADQLLPLAPNGTSYLPPLVPQQAINAASYADATKADSSISRRRKDFDERLTELRIENETAYRTLTRSLKKGTKGPRLAYMRKFWEGLESMSEYWDCSKDEYREVSAIGEDGEKSAKRQRLDSVQESQAATSRSGDDVAMESTSVDFDSDATSATVTATSDPDAALLRYRGWRTGTGRAMPDTFRINTVRAFVEGTVWPFQCCVTPPRRMPTVEFGKLRLPVRQTAAVYCLPNDRMKARQGHLEGPMFAIQVRSDTDFTDQVAWPLEAHSRLDLMRELGGLLQIAQERRREGHTEVKPGEGKWWTMKPRWGGGPGGEMEKDEGNADVAPAPEEVLGSGKEQKRRKDKGSSQARARKTPAELWKELKCGNSTWDPKTDYAAVGKDPASPYDEIFMVSSLNHHVCILKLTVHVAYVEYTISGDMPDPRPVEHDWCRPKLQRSQWYDLFSMEQRVEAYRGLWGVMNYLVRETSGSGGTEVPADNGV